MLEEIVDGLLKPISQLASIVVRSLMWLFFEFFLEVIAWYTGWCVCRVASAGQYPEEALSARDHASTFTVCVVSLVGFAFLVAVSIILAQLLL